MLIVILFLPIKSYIEESQRIIILMSYFLFVIISVVILEKCTILGYSLLFFSLLMGGMLLLLMSNNLKDRTDLPVIITLNDGTSVMALRCAITKEGLTVIKGYDKRPFIISTSAIKKIVEQKK